MLNVPLLREVQTMISNPDTMFEMENWGMCIAGCTFSIALKNRMRLPDEVMMMLQSEKIRAIRTGAIWALGLEGGHPHHLFHESNWPLRLNLEHQSLRELACLNIDALIADPAAFSLGLPPRPSPDPMQGLVRADRIIAASNLAKMIGDAPTKDDTAVELLCA